MKKTLFAVLVALSVSACTTDYDQPAASYNQYMKDGALCIMETSGVVSSVAKASWDEFWLYYYGRKLFCGNRIIRWFSWHLLCRSKVILQRGVAATKIISGHQHRNTNIFQHTSSPRPLCELFHMLLFNSNKSVCRGRTQKLREKWTTWKASVRLSEAPPGQCLQLVFRHCLECARVRHSNHTIRQTILLSEATLIRLSCSDRQQWPVENFDGWNWAHQGTISQSEDS